jgi:hypothetical protein
MPFDLGFDFRSTAGYRTDPPYGVPALAEVYPHTYTNANGYSINAGSVGGDITNPGDYSATNDPRIAGKNGRGNDGNPKDFRVDLASGSAPGAGNYTVDIAFGDPLFTTNANFKLRDTTTVLIDGTNGATGYFALTVNQYLDASLALVAGGATWTGTPVAVTFATTTANLTLNYYSGGGQDEIAHFRLTLAAPAGFTGSGSVAVPVSALAGAGTVQAIVSGTGTVAPPASALAASALEVFTGSATVAAPASALAGTALEVIGGTGNVAPPVAALAGSGTVATIAITGSGGVAPAVSALEAYGNNGAVVVGGGGGIGRHWFYQPIPRLRPEPLLAPPEPITGRGTVRAPVSQAQGTGRVAVLGRGLLVGQATEIRSDGQVMFLGRGGVRRRVASTRGAGFVGFPDDDIFGLELEELDLELA